MATLCGNWGVLGRTLSESRARAGPGPASKITKKLCQNHSKHHPTNRPKFSRTGFGEHWGRGSKIEVLGPFLTLKRYLFDPKSQKRNHKKIIPNFPRTCFGKKVITTTTSASTLPITTTPTNNNHPLPITTTPSASSDPFPTEAGHLHAD